MYQFHDDFNIKAFFWFRKKIIENKNWAMLSKAAKAIYPVIACYVNKNGVAFPSEETISILAGLSPKHVRRGIRDLEGFPSFTWDYYITKRGRRSKKYFLKLLQEPQRGEAFPFNQFILESGNWRELEKPSAKALYPVMRHFGYFDIEEYLFHEDIEAEAGDFNEIYCNRCYDFCEAEKTILAYYAGIDRTSINAALIDLQKCNLISPFEDREGWKVYLRPQKCFKRGYLNEKLMMKKYRL